MASQLGATVLANESPPDKDVHVNFLVGAELIEDAAGHAKGDEAGLLRQEARRIREEGYASLQPPSRSNQNCSSDPTLSPTTVCCPVPETSGRCCGTERWYEVFPRSSSPEAGLLRTLRDCEAWLPYVAFMGLT